MKRSWVGLAVLGLVFWTGHLPAYSQASGGNTGPSGGGGAGSPAGTGNTSSSSGLPAGPGTGGQGTAHGDAGTTPGAAGTATNAPSGMYPPTSANPATSEPPSPHAGGPISPSS